MGTGHHGNSQSFYELVVATDVTSDSIATSPSLTAGSGAPSSTKPNGSLYLRTNGSTYQMKSDAWNIMEGQGDFGATGLTTDVIAESTAGAGVTISMPDNDSVGFAVKEAANAYIICVTTNAAESVDVAKNLNATAGLDVSGAAFTVDSQAITQLTSGQVTFAGNVDAASGLDISGAALTIDSQAITQLTSGQVTFAGNVDATSGLDVSGASLTVASGQVLTTNTINETTATNGVTVDGLLLKDCDPLSDRWIVATIAVADV